MASTASQKTKNFKGDHLSIKMINAKGDAVEAADFAISSGSHTLTSAAFTSGAVAVGMVVSVAGAGAAGAWLTTTIAAVASGSVTLEDAAEATVSDAGGVFGTDNAAAFAALLDICGRKRTRYFLPSGWYLTTSTFDIQTSLEIVGNGRDNQASSVIVYVGTGDGIYAHSATPGDPIFAVNMRDVAVNTYGGCQSAVKLEYVSEGKYNQLSINNSTVARAAINLDLISPDILSFHDLIATRASDACVRIYSPAFPRSATKLVFSGKNLYQNESVFDLQANIESLTVRDCHIEQFGRLFKCDRGVGAVDLQINHLDFHGNEIVAGIGAFPTCKLFDFNIPDTTTLIAKLVSFRHNWVYFGAAQENPINLTFGTSTDADMDWEISHNEFSNVDTSLMHAENVNVRVLYVQNIKRFGDDFTPLSATSTALLLIPVYGGDSLLTANRIPHVAGAGRIASDDGLLYYGDAGEKTLEIASDNSTDGQFRVGDEATTRVVKLAVPNAIDATYTAVLEFLGALGALAINGLLTVGSNEQPPGITLYVHNDDVDGHTQFSVKANAADTGTNAIVNILTSAAAAVFQIFADGKVAMPLLDASKPLRTGIYSEMATGAIGLDTADVTSGIPTGSIAAIDTGGKLKAFAGFAVSKPMLTNSSGIPTTGDIDLANADHVTVPGSNDDVLINSEGAVGAITIAMLVSAVADGLKALFDEVYSPIGHSHEMSEITGLSDALANKAEAGHNHGYGGTTGTTLDHDHSFGGTTT